MTVQERIEENVGEALTEAKRRNGVSMTDPEGASVWALQP